MKTNFHMLRSFEYNPENYGFCTEEEVKQIEDHFCLKERSDVELQNLRDFVVMYYSERTERARKEDDDTNYLKLWDTMSAITGVIDQHKWKRGMEV